MKQKSKSEKSNPIIWRDDGTPVRKSEVLKFLDWALRSPIRSKERQAYIEGAMLALYFGVTGRGRPHGAKDSDVTQAEFDAIVKENPKRAHDNRLLGRLGRSPKK
jgi:hypothetical protein